MIAPQYMTMDVHMLGAMYAISDAVTIMAMGNYTSKSMRLQTRTNVNFNTKSGGFGDVMLSTLIKILNKNRQSLHLNAGVSIPTGSISQRDDTPMASNIVLAYPMQLGSGTWDPMLGFTYLGQTSHFSWGVQTSYKFRMSDNAENYRFGNTLNAVTWGAVKVSRALSFSTSITYNDSEQIEGADARLNPAVMPLFNTQNSGRRQLDAGVGVNVYLPKKILENLRLGAEVKYPVFQDVNGIQMQNLLMTVFGLQYAF